LSEIMEQQGQATLVDSLLRNKYSDLILLCTLLLAFIMLIIASTASA